uniref:Uncharacterized protein LOC104236193 n=1 Tax=Nicotiana sylvestris TaxID=4096 RepID=A0A1U7XFE6_NICSY|nr:PREDICTED: uncharacterized protein LOC104236193 [Nicotiana sylvestris]
MQSQNLLPISNPNSSNMIPTSSSATADTMLILVQENDDSKIEKKPLLSRTFSYTSSSSSSNLLKQQQRRRRIASENSLCSVAVESCSQDMERAASDTFVVTKLSFTLLRYLG